MSHSVSTGRPAVAIARSSAVVLVAALMLAGPLVALSDSSPATSERHHNGRLPASELVEVGGIQLRADAAAAYHAMLAAASQEGVSVVATGGYRTYERQVRLKAEKPVLAAPPGTSMHGWGRAVDFDMRLTDFGWLRAHAAEFGWVHPPWAQPDGSKPEPWHWEFVGRPTAPGSAALADPVPPPAPEPGELIAMVRFEPRDEPPAGWFTVHAGLDGIIEGARHYEGTALPGATGNFAVAGYHRAHSAPLRGITDLTPGDTIRVRVPGTDGEDDRYEVLGGEVVTAADGWAVGPRPRHDGGDRLMTLSTGTDDGDLLVVWSRLRTD